MAAWDSGDSSASSRKKIRRTIPARRRSMAVWDSGDSSTSSRKKIRRTIPARRRSMAVWDSGDSSPASSGKKIRRTIPAVPSFQSCPSWEDDCEEEEERQSSQEPSESDDGGDGDEEVRQSSQEPLESDAGGDGDEEDDVSEGGGAHKGSSQLPSSKRAVIANVTVEDGHALDCGVCCLPLKPPVFQCGVGHVVCLPCLDKLAAAGRCHVCRGPTADSGYRRCHAMEHLVESIRVPCPNAAHGCAAKPAYYDLRAHSQACTHSPCHCPGDACGFVGSMTALLDHFAGTHSWPCTTKARVEESFVINLHDGFNVVAAGDDQGTTIANQFLFVLNMAQEPFGRVISAFCIHPHAAVVEESSPPSRTMKCELEFTHSYFNRYSRRGGDLCRSHYQRSFFSVACTDLSNGVPNPDDCFQFIVPNFLYRDKDTIEVKAILLPPSAQWRTQDQILGMAGMTEL